MRLKVSKSSAGVSNLVLGLGPSPGGLGLAPGALSKVRKPGGIGFDAGRGAGLLRCPGSGSGSMFGILFRLGRAGKLAWSIGDTFGRPLFFRAATVFLN